MDWIILVLVYGILKGIRDISKKRALETNGVVEVLFVYTLIAFLFCIPDVRNAGGVATKDLLWTAFKSFIIFVAFICSFYAIEKMPISLYGVLDLSRMMFSMLLGVLILHESLGLFQWLGLILVVAGIVLLKYKPAFLKKKDQPLAVEEKKTEKVGTLFIVLAFVSTFLNAISGIMDKILMRTMTSAQLQFWYMLFMLIYYFIYVIITKTKITKSVWKNYHVWLIAILFIIADRCLFIANGIADSSVTVMTLIKQICVLVTIIGGRLVFKEKDIWYRIFCAMVVVAGIALSVL